LFRVGIIFLVIGFKSGVIPFISLFALLLEVFRVFAFSLNKIFLGAAFAVISKTVRLSLILIKLFYLLSFFTTLTEFSFLG
jgi:hypothetical protein